VKGLPDALPIVRPRLARDGRQTSYLEHEVVAPLDLCDPRGRLNPAAVGWSRRPLVRANLSRHWLRKKRWNFWNWIFPGGVLSVTVADIDYAAFCEATFTDFADGASMTVTAPALPGSIALAEEVERSVEFAGGSIRYACLHDGDRLEITLDAKDRRGNPLSARLLVTKPAGHETLNIVVPWTAQRFQLNSKHCALPTSGTIRAGEREHLLRPAEAHAVQDFGRGVWPYRSFWNWAVATGVEDGTSIGVNMGGKWTTGTGVNENALCIDGRLHKVMEDLEWRYDPAAPLEPWRVLAPQSRMIDLTLEPIAVRTPRISLGVIRSGGVCAFGRWRGTVRCADRELPVRALLGWAEEFDHRW
jgi:hypothetical protein